jgi:hypothetical protein
VGRGFHPPGLGVSHQVTNFFGRDEMTGLDELTEY